MSKVDAIKYWLERGRSGDWIASYLGLSKSTVSYHRKRLGYGNPSQRKYDWDEIAGYQRDGASVKECKARFGISDTVWHGAVKRGVVSSKFKGRKRGEYLGNSTKTLRIILQKEGRNLDRCEDCGITNMWNGKELTLQIHHIDGNRKNNVCDNLMVLCPNCHTQTETYAKKKI